jgi:hypothetical protein
MCHLAGMLHAMKPQVIFVSKNKSLKVNYADSIARFNICIVVPSRRRSGGQGGIGALADADR